MAVVRILHVVGNMDFGGVETFLMNLYRSVDRQAVQFDFLCHNDVAGKFDSEIRDLGGVIVRIPGIGASSLPRYRRALREAFEVHSDYQIVHSHLSRMNGVVLREARRGGRPIRISHSHIDGGTHGIARDALYSYSKMLIAGSATHGMACSLDAARHVHSGQLLRDTTILPNAIDTEKFSPSEDRRALIRRDLGIADEFVIGHVGRLTPQKNHQHLVEVFHRVHDADRRARLLLVGVGALEDEVKRDVQSRGLSGAVSFLGARPDVRDLMDAMDIFAFPSRWEGLGIVAVEAQAMGLPVLASEAVPRETALTDLISYLPLGEATPWVERILAEMHNGNARSRAGYSAEVAHGGYDIKRVARELQDFYVRLAEGAPDERGKS